MPTTALLRLARREGVTTPHFFDIDDEPWIAAVIAAFDGFVGATVGTRERELPSALLRISREHAVSLRTVEGVRDVLSRKYPREVRSALRPADARRVVFLESAALPAFDRSGALARASSLLAVAVDELESALVADSPAERRIQAASARVTPSDVVDACNLAIVEALLLRSLRVVVHLGDHVHAVVRYAKRAGLVCTYDVDALGARLDVSGPLSLLRTTTKYGRALARFFPAIAATPGFRLDASCLLDGQSVEVRIDGAQRVARTRALPRDGDNLVERALVRDVRRLGGWSIERDVPPFPLAGGVLFPDFVLRRDEACVVVDVLPEHGVEYVRSRVRALRRAIAHPLVVCVDADLPCADDELEAPSLRFKRRIDARALLALADEQVAR